MSYVSHAYHIVFSTKNREPNIAPSFQDLLYEYIGGIIREKKGHLIEVGGVQDHVHILAHLHQSFPHADVIRDIKSGSSTWVNDNGYGLGHFAWQSKYGSFTVSRSKEEDVARYIQNQAEHHRTVTFQEEFRAWVRKHGVPVDERYMWE